MNEKDLKNILEQAVPDVPPVFHQAMERTLETLQNEDKPVWHARRALILAFVIALAIATAAYAAYRWRVFEEISFMTGENPVHADSLMQSQLHQETVNGVVITIHEAGYDGRTLLIRYSYLTPDGRDPYEHGVGWWVDHFWIDGACMDMAANSGSSQSIGERGEIIQTEYWRLDNLGVTLTGRVEIALPIGERQPLVTRAEHPEKFDASGNLLRPDKGLVTFTLDTGDAFSRVVTETPRIPAVLADVTASVKEVSFTPLMTYITLELEVNPEAMKAFIAENGEGYVDEQGKLIFPYNGSDVFGGWVRSLELVDAQGRQLFPGHWGNNGYGSQWAEFLYPYIENLPGELWLAPVTDGMGDLTQAVRVR